MTLVHWFEDQLHSNQFVSAGLIAAPASAAMYALRSVPAKIGRFVKKWSSIDVRFNNDMAGYDDALRFITSEVIVERFTRNYNFQSESKWDWESDSREVTGRSLDIGYGNHIGFFKGHLCFINRSVDTDAKTEKFKEFTHVRIVARSKEVLGDFKDAIEEFAGRARDGQERISLKINSGSYWSPVGTLPMRGINTVFSANDAAKQIVDHLEAFDSKREWNHSKGLPHRTGIILYGPPGNGKSSLIHAVASATKRTLLYLSLASVDNDKEAIELIRSHKDWYRALLVIEDFDAAGIDLQRDEDEPEEDGDGEESKPKKGKRNKKQPISLSTILNLLDGVISPDGMAVIATTNHPDRLDEALRRPGRFDLQIELGFCGKDQFVQMAELFEIDPSTYSLDTFAPMTGSKLRSLLLEGGVPAVEAYQMGLAA